MIVPNKLATASYAAELRKYMLSSGCVSRIRDYSAVKVFPVAVYPVVFVFDKSNKNDETTYQLMTEEDGVINLKAENRVSLDKEATVWPLGAGAERSFSAKNFLKLGDVASEISDAATVSEAYDLTALLVEREKPLVGDLIFVNSGTIDPYRVLWGLRETRYIKMSYVHPVLEKKRLPNYSANRIRQAQQKKILVANMTKRLEAVYDASGSILAGKSVNVILVDNYNPAVVLAVLNSAFMSEYYARQFHGRKLAGGYLQVAPAALKELPLPKQVPPHTEKAIVSLVSRIEDASIKMNVLKDEHQRDVARRLLLELQHEIERLVLELYKPS
jgi:hypothetical protein